MVNNLKCEYCQKLSVCAIFKKIKPFTDLAKIDLGVNLDMTDCEEFLPIQIED